MSIYDSAGLESGDTTGAQTQNLTLDEFEDIDCPHGEEWCPGPDSDELPCFACFGVQK